MSNDNNLNHEAPAGASGEASISLNAAPLKRIRMLLDAVAKLCNWLASVIMVFVVITFGWMVFSRYVLGHTPTWISQLGLLLFIYIVCLGAAAGVHQGIHLSIDFVRESFPRPLRIVSHAISDLIMLIFSVTMTYEGWHLTLANANHTIPLLGISASWRALPLIFCGVLIGVFIIFNVTERLIKYNGGTH